MLLKKLRMLFHSHDKSTEDKRKNRLIHTITFEILILAIFLECINFYLNLWMLTVLILIGIIVALINLYLLKKNYSIFLCGHIVNSISLVMIFFVNLWLGDQVNSCVEWFYIPPMIAAATIGLNGLISYGLLSAFLIFFFIDGNFHPLYILQEDYIALLNNFNHTFIFLLIITIVYNASSENKRYESLLKEKNYLLHADKQKFHYLSYHDSLTNLPNRPYFNQYLQTIIDSTNPAINSITLFFMDLDGFKKINDKYGHNIGDILLLLTSKRLQSCFRENDFIARLGGDEFTAVIIHNLNDNIANEIVDRIEQEFFSPFLIQDLEIKCSISVGNANYPLDSLEAETLLKIADDLMYKNKKKKYERINKIENPN